VQTGQGSAANPGSPCRSTSICITTRARRRRVCNPIFRIVPRLGAFLGPTPLTTRPQSDEPSDIAITPDGRFLYVLNGGVAAFGPPDPDKAWTGYESTVAPNPRRA
jgi:hypothetical protein